MFSEIYKKIEEYDTIIIHRHIYPDCDAFGSQLGLKHSILETFPNKNVYAVGEVHKLFSFFTEMDEIDNSIYQNALVIVTDTGSQGMISDDRYNNGDCLIKIDHHVNNDPYGDICFVNEQASSTCEIITELIKTTPLIMNDTSATSLYAGIVTDTGRFLYPSISKDTFDLTSYLLEYNVDFSSLYNELYEQTDNIVKLKGYFMMNYQVTENGVAYMKNDATVAEKYMTDFFTVSRGMVNTMANIKNIPVWVNFTEDPESNKISMELRAQTESVVDIAVKYGGGGHKLACGATLDNWETVELVLNDLDKRAKESKKTT